MIAQLWGSERQLQENMGCGQEAIENIRSELQNRLKNVSYQLWYGAKSQGLWGVKLKV